jgi:hypothetical protein
MANRSKHPQFNRRLPQAVHDAIKRLAKKWQVSEAKVVERAVAKANTSTQNRPKRAL